MTDTQGWKIVSDDPDKPLVPKWNFDWVFKAEIEKIEDDEMRVSGFASVEEVDKQNDMIVIEAFERAVKRLDEDGEKLPLHLNHTTIHVGTVDRITFLKDVAPRKFHISAKFKKNSKAAQETYRLVKEGKLKAFSIGGAVLSHIRYCTQKGLCFNKIDDIELYEVSLVENPANEKSLIYAVKSAIPQLKKVEYMKDEHETLIQKGAGCSGGGGGKEKPFPKDEKEAPPEEEPKEEKSACPDKVKALEQRVSELEKQLELIGKPFAGYKNFDACVSANQKKDNPQAYCGEVMHQVEGKSEESVKKSEAPAPATKAKDEEKKPVSPEEETPKKKPAEEEEWATEKAKLLGQIEALNAEIKSRKEAEEKAKAAQPTNPTPVKEPERKGVVVDAIPGSAQKRSVMDLARELNEKRVPMNKTKA